MDLKNVIEGLVEEKGFDKEKIIEILCKGVASVYAKKFPSADIIALFNKRSGQIEVVAHKLVTTLVSDDNREISLRRARAIDPQASLGDMIKVPFDGVVGRVEIAAARQLIAASIRELEQQAVFDEYKDREGEIIGGMIHKRERGGFVVKLGDTQALLPEDNLVPGETLRVGHPVKALLKEVNLFARGDYQLILDRASADFVKKLISLEIPEIFEGIVEIKKIVRSPGYKSKAIVVSSSKEIDPVGTCVGVGGARIKPILRELGQEKIDLIEWTDALEVLVKNSLKPAEIDKVELSGDSRKATVWLARDQRSYAIGRSGQNVALASRLTGVEIRLQDFSHPEASDGLFAEPDDEGEQ